MTTRAAKPKPPATLAPPGRKLWRAILADLADGWELDRRELHLLEQACRCADDIAQLEQAVKRDGATVAGSRGQTVVHPAVTEARQLRIAQARLLGVIELEDPAVVRARMSPASRRAQAAAEARWGKGRRVPEVG
jgi:P27 family predicted phage terminase small subunit